MCQYAEQLTSLRTIRRKFFQGFFVYLPIGVTLLFIGAKLFHNDAAGVLLMLPLLVPGAIAQCRLQMFSCPRCSEYFFGNWWRQNLFARSCRHCHLPIFSR